MRLKYINKHWVAILGLFLIINLSFSQEKKGILVDEIIAKVDNFIILKSDLEGAYQQALASGQYAANMK